MIAKIKASGKLIEGFSVPNISAPDQWLYFQEYNGTMWSREEIELTDNKNGRKEIIEVATAAMQAILSNERTMITYTEIVADLPNGSLVDIVARNAVRYANALITEIDKQIFNTHEV